MIYISARNVFVERLKYKIHRCAQINSMRQVYIAIDRHFNIEIFFSFFFFSLHHARKNPLKCNRQKIAVFQSQ